MELRKSVEGGAQNEQGIKEEKRYQVIFSIVEPILTLILKITYGFLLVEFVKGKEKRRRKRESMWRAGQAISLERCSFLKQY